MSYTAPVEEMVFLFEHILNGARLENCNEFDDVSVETVEAILNEAAKLAENSLAPLQRPGDEYPARLEDGKVICAPGFKEGLKLICDGGWVGISASPEYGGMGLPMTLCACVNEMMASACTSLSLNPVLSQGQIEALEHHASDKIKALYLPKLTSGEWHGTMSLTEPQAGSDVGALRTQATLNDNGSYDITGQKIFISWADHELADNICNLCLARLPNSPKGTKGISLFIVPKYIPNEDGTLGDRSSMNVVSLEHKLGLHGSPTAILEYKNAKGWLIGEENNGMAAMFTMMNNARLSVGVQGLGISEAAYQMALEFSLERVQGRSLIENGVGTIIDHADIRRMLLTMKSLTMAARAICMDTAIHIDLGNALDDKTYKARASLLTPIAKSFATDVGCRVADLGIQIHGGMGYIEETGATQYLRDARVMPIYEGTNGIQAMDLVGRKLADNGDAAFALLDEIKDFAGSGSSSCTNKLTAAESSLREATNWMLSVENINDRFAGATPYQSAMGLLLGGYYLAKGASHSVDRANIAGFYLDQLLPQAIPLAQSACVGAEQLYAVSNDAL